MTVLGVGIDLYISWQGRESQRDIINSEKDTGHGLVSIGVDVSALSSTTQPCYSNVNKYRQFQLSILSANCIIFIFIYSQHLCVGWFHPIRPLAWNVFIYQLWNEFENELLSKQNKQQNNLLSQLWSFRALAETVCQHYLLERFPMRCDETLRELNKSSLRIEAHIFSKCLHGSQIVPNHHSLYLTNQFYLHLKA